MGDTSHEPVLHTAAASLLHPLADDLMAIALRLRDAAIGPQHHQYAPDHLTPDQPAADQPRPRSPSAASGHLALARRAYSLRRKRAAIFGNPDLFGEPAWDIMLDLFIAHFEGKPVSVSSACIGSASPPTTGLRWLGVLADEGLILREADPADNRRVLVRLTATGIAAMERYFEVAEGAS
jgi:hypothetical protein